MKLMHCPFCGSVAVEVMLSVRGINKNDQFTSHVRCNGCGVQGPPCDSPKYATELWNGRLTLDTDTSLRVAFKLTP